MIWQSVRTDSLKYEPIRVGPALGPADLILMSPSRSGSTHNTDIIELYKKFDDLTYFYIAICVTLVLVMLVSTWYLERSLVKTIKRKLRRIAKETMVALWSVYESVISQNAFDPSSLSTRIVLLFFVESTFCAIMGVLLNLM